MWKPALLGAALLLLLLPLPGEADESQYVGVAKCKSCHKKELIGRQHAAWQKAPHARAFETLRSEASRAIAQRLGIEGPPHEAAACLRCHSTAFGVSEQQMEFPLERSDGVQCESCHGPGSRYRKKKIMSKPEKAKSLGLWDAAEEAVCTRCHNRESPTFDPRRFSLPDGGHAGFDLEQAMKQIAHPIPDHVKGRYLELEKRQKAAEREARAREREARR